MECKGNIFLGRFDVPVKNGRFILPRPLRLFEGKDALVVRVQGRKFLSLVEKTTLEKEAPLAVQAFENYGDAALDSRGRIRVGRNIMEKVFGCVSFDAYIIGCFNTIQLWKKEDYAKFMEQNSALLGEEGIGRLRDSIVKGS